MDRDLVLAGLVIAGVGATVLVAGVWPQTVGEPGSARGWERILWRALWRPMLPAVVVTSILIGWAIMEPAESDEYLPSSIVLVSGLFVTLWLRAGIRGIHALKPRGPYLASTVGFWRPRVRVSEALLARVDADVLQAIEAHEAAHVRHRDPLRIWLAQFVTDLQWPSPAAHDRFRQWRRVLELARDEEARIAGTDGADLASAVLLAVRLQTAAANGATLIESECDLQDRIARLLAPIPSDDMPVRATSTLAVFPVSFLGVLSGVRFGEGLVQAIVRWLP